MESLSLQLLKRCASLHSTLECVVHMAVGECASAVSCGTVESLLLQLNALVARSTVEEQKLVQSVVGKRQVSIASDEECKPMIEQMVKCNTVKTREEPLPAKRTRRS